MCEVLDLIPSIPKNKKNLYRREHVQEAQGKSKVFVFLFWLLESEPWALFPSRCCTQPIF